MVFHSAMSHNTARRHRRHVRQNISPGLRTTHVSIGIRAMEVLGPPLTSSIENHQVRLVLLNPEGQAGLVGPGFRGFRWGL